MYNKNVEIKFIANNLHQVHSKTANWKAKKLKSFGSMKTKGPKQDSLNQLRSPIPKGVSIIIT